MFSFTEIMSYSRKRDLYLFAKNKMQTLSATT